MTKNILAIGAAATLVLLATVGAFAAQDRLPVLSSSLDLLAADTPTPDATQTATPEGTATETATAEPTATGTVEPTATGTLEATATGTPSGATETPTPEPTSTPDIHGIPEDNPAHHDDNGDDVCDKHETIIKTTPSGNLVRVPCETQKHNGSHGHGHGHNADE
jgi:hypothetical protein